MYAMRIQVAQSQGASKFEKREVRPVFGGQTQKMVELIVICFESFVREAEILKLEGRRSNWCGEDGARGLRAGK